MLVVKLPHLWTQGRIIRYFSFASKRLCAWLMDGSLDQNLVDVARTLGYFGTYLFAWYYYAAARKRNILKLFKFRLIIFTSLEGRILKNEKGQRPLWLISGCSCQGFRIKSMLCQNRSLHGSCT